MPRLKGGVPAKGAPSFAFPDIQQKNSTDNVEWERGLFLEKFQQQNPYSFLRPGILGCPTWPRDPGAP